MIIKYLDLFLPGSAHIHPNPEHNNHRLLFQPQTYRTFFLVVYLSLLDGVLSTNCLEQQEHTMRIGVIQPEI